MTPLNWDRNLGPVDGVVKSQTDPTTGLKRYTVLRHASMRGVSFFDPVPEYLDRIHEHLRPSACGFTVPNTQLPEHMAFANDNMLELKLPVNGVEGDEVVVCGKHWSLHTTTNRPAADFEVDYDIFEKTLLVCQPQSEAEVLEWDLDLDLDRMPTDTLTYAAVVAMEQLHKKTKDPNVRLFSWLFSNHLRAVDLPFEDLLHSPEYAPIASMAAASLDAWIVPHRMYEADAWKAQDQLAAVLDDYQPSRPIYQAFWEVHPFQFLDGHFNDKLYDDVVRTNAIAFVGDDLLKTKIEKCATHLLEDLRASTLMSPCHEDVVVHEGVTFKVVECRQIANWENNLPHEWQEYWCLLQASPTPYGNHVKKHMFSFFFTPRKVCKVFICCHYHIFSELRRTSLPRSPSGPA